MRRSELKISRKVVCLQEKNKKFLNKSYPNILMIDRNIYFQTTTEKKQSEAEQFENQMVSYHAL